MRKIHDVDIDWPKEIDKAETTYNFQPKLTAKLDNHTGDFTDVTFLEIVLWKTNRYPELNVEVIDDINDLRKSYSEEKARLTLKKLLALKGFDLPMASTVLRFACPTKLQIIDQHAYRFVTPEADAFKIPYNDDKKINVYFNYIDNLKGICEKHNIPFNKADRILYQLDKELNEGIPIKYKLINYVRYSY